MKYTTFMIILIGFLLGLGACDDTTPAPQEKVLTVGFKDTLKTIYENSGQNKLELQLSRPATMDMVVRILVKNENNIQENLNYVLADKEIVIAKGKSSAEVILEMIDDKIVNGDRSLILEILPDNHATGKEYYTTCHITVLDDENDTAVTFSQMAYAVREDAGEAIIPLTIEGPRKSDIKVTVTVMSVPGTIPALEGENFILPDSTVVIAKDADITNAGILVKPITDHMVSEENKVFLLEITQIIGATKITEKSACLVTILNTDLGIRFASAQAAVEENPQQNTVLSLPVKVIGTASGDLKVKLKVIDGTAVLGQDFDMPQEVVLPVGQDSVNIDITTRYNSDITGNRNFQLEVAEIEGHPEIGLTGIKCDVTLYDYDTKLTLGSKGIAIGADYDGYQIPVHLSQAVHHPIALSISPADRTTLEPDNYVVTDYITIKPGTTDTVINVTTYGITGLLGLDITPESGITEAHFNAPAFDLKVNETIDYGTVDRTSIWSVLAVSDVRTDDGGGKDKILDLDPNTYWHSMWGPDAPLPHWSIVDFGKKMGICTLTVVRRVSGNYDTKTVKLYVSETKLEGDSPDWIYLGTLSYPKDKRDDSRTLDVRPKVVQGRYVKILVTESNRSPFTSIATFSISGYDAE